MKQVNIHEAKTHLSRLIDEVEAGEEIVIARGGKPAARLMALPNDAPVRFGVLKGKFEIHPEFYDPLPDDILDLFEGKED